LAVNSCVISCLVSISANTIVTLSCRVYSIRDHNGFYVQAVSKDLWAASKLKTCPSLQSWSRSVQNALWWCFEHCEGDNYFMN
jgi:hypothetical protein